MSFVFKGPALTQSAFYKTTAQVTCNVTQSSISFGGNWSPTWYYNGSKITSDTDSRYSNTTNMAAGTATLNIAQALTTDSGK